MTTVKIIGATINDRKNQSTTFFFSGVKYGFKLDEHPTENWIRKNISKINIDIVLNKQSKIIISK